MEEEDGMWPRRWREASPGLRCSSRNVRVSVAWLRDSSAFPVCTVLSPSSYESL